MDGATRRSASRLVLLVVCSAASILMPLAASAAPFCLPSTKFFTYCGDEFDTPHLEFGETSDLVPGWITTGDVTRVSVPSTDWYYGREIAPHLALRGPASATWVTPYVVDGMPKPPTSWPPIWVDNRYQFQWHLIVDLGTSGRVAAYAGGLLMSEFRILPHYHYGDIVDGVHHFQSAPGLGYFVRDAADPRIGQPISWLFEITEGTLRVDHVGAWHVYRVYIPEPGSLALLAIGLVGVGVTRRRA